MKNILEKGGRRGTTEEGSGVGEGEGVVGNDKRNVKVNRKNV